MTVRNIKKDKGNTQASCTTGTAYGLVEDQTEEKCMEGQKFDMEVTDERADFMKKQLLRLYADQLGMEVVSVTVTPKTKEGTA